MHSPRILLSPPHLAAGSTDAVAACLASGWVAPAGPQIVAFEEAVAAAVGRRFGVATSSGTAALHLALRVLGIGPGDTVISPTLTFVAGANPILYLGAVPVFVDSEPTTWNLDPNTLEDALGTLDREGRRPKAVIATHLYGRCADMAAIETLCSRFDVPIVEDAAEALGASYHGRQAGSFGRVSMLSFNGNKTITTGGGGMLLTDDPALAARAALLAAQAREPGLPEHRHLEMGYTYRLSSVLAALGSAQLPMLRTYVARRRSHFAGYRERLGGLPGVSFLGDRVGVYDSHWLSTVTIDETASGGVDWRKVHRRLAEGGIESRPLWLPMHLQPLFQKARYVGGHVAERAYNTSLCLPSGSSLTEDERLEVCSVFEKCWQDAI